MKNIALYIHIPFCNSKCFYCDFYSVCKNDAVKSEFEKALYREIEDRAEILKNAKISSIYIGGGTPSVMPPSFFVRLKKALDKYCVYSNNLEFSVEVNPNSFSEELAKKFVQIGVNRISIGLQTSVDKLLKMVGRIHNFSEFKNCVKIVKRYFQNFSVDLMVGLPGQKLRDVKKTLKQVLKFKPKHISCYNLILEEGTPLFKNQKLIEKIPSETAELKMMNFVAKFLERRNFQSYEVSNFSLRGEKNEDEFISFHNKVYWLGGDYLGFGPSASSFIGGERITAGRSLDAYILGKNTAFREIITPKKRREEKIMLGLRTKWGCERKLCNQKELAILQEYGFVKLTGKRVVATKKGIKVLNLIIERLI